MIKVANTIECLHCVSGLREGMVAIQQSAPLFGVPLPRSSKNPLHGHIYARILRSTSLGCPQSCRAMVLHFKGHKDYVGNVLKYWFLGPT